MKVLLTGHTGYIGSVMVTHLLRAGHDVIGLDIGYFADCTLGPDEPRAIEERRADIRRLALDDLVGLDAVVHLAALSNDPLGALHPAWTDDINHHGSVRLARLAREAGVERFVLASSCALYGRVGGGLRAGPGVDETAPLDPRTEYARSKVDGERGISALATDTFSPTFLRNPTVYGMSPRMRFDTVLNQLTGWAVTGGTVAVRSDGTPWRPLLHVDDLCHSVVSVLGARRELVHDQAFNVGADHLNARVIDLAELVVDAVPGASLVVEGQPSADERSYRVDFGKFADTFPEVEFAVTLEAGVKRLANELGAIGLSASDVDSPRFTRLARLCELIDSGRVDAHLRWQDGR